MTARVQWKGGLSFTGGAESGLKVPLAGDASVGGAEDGFRPMELIAIGIAGCTAMDVISILTKKNQRVTGFEVLVHTRQAKDHPKVFAQIDIEYVVAGEQIEEGGLAAVGIADQGDGGALAG